LIAKAGRTALNPPVQFELNLTPAKRLSAGTFLALTDQQIPMAMIRSPRARRYVLRLRPDGSARVTIPRGGSLAEGRKFAERNVEWFERQLQRLAARPNRRQAWGIGTEVLFRGERVKLEAAVNGERGLIRFGDEVLRVTDPAADLRPAIESHLWRLAAKELPAVVLGYAALHQWPVRRITVRNQRSRWGSCSRRGTISLNWRLIQAPEFVRDYLCLHELVHLREMNHTARFWREVERVCPDYPTAEKWLKQHSSLLR
jgi:predicted metal-dependent hydrolase